MNKLKQLSAGKQVLLTFGTLCAILLIIGGMSVFTLRLIERDNQMQLRAMNKLALIDDTAQDIGQMQAEVLSQVLASDMGSIKRLDQKVRDLEKTNSKELADYQKFVGTGKECQLYDRVMQTRKAYWEDTQRVLSHGLANQDAEAMEVIDFKQVREYDEYLNAISELIKYTETDADETAKATADFTFKIGIAGYILVGVAMLVAIGIGFAVAGIARRLREDIRSLQVEVTERKRAEDELRWKTAFLEAQVNSSIDGILVVDQQGKQILQNQRTVDLFKIPQAIADENDDAAQVRWVMNAIKNPEQFVEKIGHLYSHPDEISRDEIELKDGTTLDRYSSPVVGKDEKHYGRIWTFRDITERKRFEAQLFQSQKMETVGRLAGGVAHEFNSILTAIIGQSEFLLDELPPGLPLSKSAAEIRKAADLAAGLTRQLLAYGRKQLLQPETLDLEKVMAGAETMLRHVTGGNVDVRIVADAGLKRVQADAAQIEQVILNMALNARDAMPHGGKLTIEASNVAFDQDGMGGSPELKKGNYVMMAVTDTGVGMSEEVRSHVFEPFFSTKDVGKGTGLGLSTCYGILKQSGGHITVYSEPARGTTFKIYLPEVQGEPQARLPSGRPTSLPRGTETILLVEDDAGLREMASTLLRRLGYRVLVSADGVEALNLVEQRGRESIDLLFTDVVMPHLDGRELSDRILASRPQTRILFTSAYTENAMIHQEALNPDVALLQKPFTPSALASKVREVLDRNQDQKENLPVPEREVPPCGLASAVLARPLG